jgi:dUTP pyrophosphatase
MAYILYIVPTEGARATYEAAAEAYNSRHYEQRDAGFDLFSAAISAEGTTRIQQQISAAFYDNAMGLYRAFWLLPRSSLSRTPLRLANSVGLIDGGYRGPIMAACDGTYSVGGDERLFQLASPDLLPWDEVRVVSEIPGGPTRRGAGGFGSTGIRGPVVEALDISGARIGDVGFSTPS